MCVLGEFGKKLKEMASPYANSNQTGLARILLQLYSKSGKGNVLDPSAYSEKEKNTPPIPSPALTLIGETVPSSFYENLDEGLIEDGLLPRFLTFEYLGARPYLNEGTEHIHAPFQLVERMRDLVSQCIQLAGRDSVHNVEMDKEAKVKFREFERWTTDQINAHGDNAHKQLWNRAHLKALKLAAVVAVGRNYLQPIITLEECLWATNEVVTQTNKLLAKFELGEIGNPQGNEGKQMREVLKVVASYVTEHHGKYERYGGSFEMHKAGVILESHIQRRLVSMACFRQDRVGATNAIKRTLKSLVDADELREVAKPQMQTAYGTGGRAYVVADPTRFVDALKVSE